MTLAKFLCNHGIVKNTSAGNKNNRIDFVLADGTTFWHKTVLGLAAYTGKEIIHRWTSKLVSIYRDFPVEQFLRLDKRTKNELIRRCLEFELIFLKDTSKIR